MDLAHFWNTSGAYEIKQSLRFNSADSTELTKTFGSSGSSRLMTFSAWVKRSNLTSTNTTTGTKTIFGAKDSSYDRDQIRFEHNASGRGDQLSISLRSYFISTSAVFRDCSAWYHVVIVIDTAQATAADRVKFYVNNSQITSFSTATYPPQNYDVVGFNKSTSSFNIGSDGYPGPTQFFDGYIAEVNFIDGTALTPSSFGETDTITGAWIPKKYSGSFGTNGFYLKFEGSGIGTDSSGNGNNWTANNFSTSGTGTDVMSDTPTNNYCTWNPINKGPNAGSYGSQLSDGNLVLAYNRTAGDFYATSTFGLPTTGKWYWEQRLTSTGSIFAIMGIAELNWTWNVSPKVSYFSSGKIVTSPDNSSDAQTGLSTYTTGDVIGHAWDADAGTLQFYKNGTAVGNPQAPTTTSGITFAIAFNAGSDTGWTTVLNCGQRAFEQTPPTGYKALNTANLPEPTIKKGGAHFNTVLYTGNGSTQSITGVGFQPDWIWCKSRNSSSSHTLTDAVRGADRQLWSNLTTSEQTNSTDFITSFNSDGFTSGPSSSGTGNTNSSGVTFVAWNWKANGAGSSNTAGTITSTVSANATAGFSIATYTGNGTAGATVGHGLGVAPKMIIVKQRSGATDWQIGHTEIGWTKTLYFNTSAATTETGAWNDTAPTSTVFSIGTSRANTSSATYVAYCFSEVAGYSKFGSYVGNGSTTDGPFIWCGFTPRFILIKWYKDVSSAESWHIYDTARQTYNANNTILQPDSSGAEETPADRYIDILSNGFKLRQNGQQINRSGASYIFAAFASTPFKFANAR